MSEVTKVHCNGCGCLTRHEFVAVEKQEEYDALGVHEIILHEMLKCRGCESVSLRQTWQWGDGKPSVIQYPPIIARRMPEWADLASAIMGDPVPTHICNLMHEIYIAVKANSRRLAAMGIRAALEAVMIDKIGDQGNFGSNTDKFFEKGYLSLRQSGHLEEILQAGHAAIHRGWEPTDEDISTLLDIAESIIETSYLHDEPVNALSKKIPPRASKPRKRN